MAQRCEAEPCGQWATHFRDVPWQSDKYPSLAGLIREHCCEAHAQYEPGRGVWYPLFWVREVGA